MPLESLEPKGRHWENIALPVIGSLIPGVYGNPLITVDEYGRIVNAIAGPSATGVGAQNAGTPLAGGPFTVLNFAGGNISAAAAGGGVVDITISSVGSVEALDEGIAIAGGPFDTFNFVGTNIVTTSTIAGQLDVTITGTTPNNVQYLKSAITTLASQLIGVPIASTALVRTVTVTITTPYTVGGAVEVRDGNGAVLLPAGMINAQVAGSYALETPGNLTAISNTQVVVIVLGGPVSGAGVVDVIYETP